MERQHKEAVGSATADANILRLLDGTELTGYPKEQPISPEDNGLWLDTTGRHLVSTGKEVEAMSGDGDNDDEALFAENAFRLLDNRNRIMSDSRMFLAPVRLANSRCLVDASGIVSPLLGAYLEWWLNCGSAIVDSHRNEPWLVYSLTGSPLTGSNHCCIVNQSGQTDITKIDCYHDSRKEFVAINRRYRKARRLYQAYTLREVVERLATESDDRSLERVIFLQQHEINTLRRKMEEAEATHRRKREALLTALFDQKTDQLRRWQTLSLRMEELQKQQLTDMEEQKRQLRRQLRSGELSNVDYQRQLTPLKNDIFLQKMKIGSVRLRMLAKILPVVDMDHFENLYSIEEVEAYLRRKDSEAD